VDAVDLMDPGFWRDDVVGNGVPAAIGFALGQVGRLGTAWYKRRVRGPFWTPLAEGKTGIVFDHPGDPTRDEVSALSTFRKHWTSLSIELTEQVSYVDRWPEAVLENDNMIVIGAKAPGELALSPLIRSLISQYWEPTDLEPELPSQAEGYLFFLPNPHAPRRRVIIATGSHAQSAWAVARWVTSDRFPKDEFVASGRPFMHIVSFASGGVVPSIQSHQGRWPRP
jgi:hypothetical protein